MKPYIADHIETPDGRVKSKVYPQALSQAVNPETAEIIKEMMIECVNNGTGGDAAAKIAQVAGKTGTAQNPAGDDHSWFTGFAPADDPQIAIAVILENAGSSSTAAQLGREALERYLRQ
jgi:peptidoglycan glycosyltransferase